MSPLNPVELTNSLAAFADESDAAFAGFPMTRERTRQRWAEAFFLYVSDMVAIGPVSIVPDNTSALFSAVEAAFRGPLTFNPVIDPVLPALELANAWRAAIAAITLVPGAQYGGNTAPPITSIDPFPAPLLDARRQTLFGSLQTLFRAPSATTRIRLRALADVFHLATTDLTTTCTVAGSPTPVPLIFG